jgi:hypothetical protein
MDCGGTGRKGSGQVAEGRGRQVPVGKRRRAEARKRGGAKRSDGGADGRRKGTAARGTEMSTGEGTKPSTPRDPVQPCGEAWTKTVPNRLRPYHASRRQPARPRSVDFLCPGGGSGGRRIRCAGRLVRRGGGLEAPGGTLRGGESGEAASGGTASGWRRAAGGERRAAGRRAAGQWAAGRRAAGGRPARRLIGSTWRRAASRRGGRSAEMVHASRPGPAPHRTWEQNAPQPAASSPHLACPLHAASERWTSTRPSMGASTRPHDLGF